MSTINVDFINSASQSYVTMGTVSLPNTINIPTGASAGYVLTSNSTGDAYWTASSGGNTEPIAISYSDLYDKIVNSQLITGAKYKLTDYKSVNFLNGWKIANDNPTPTDPSFDPREIYTSDNEVLILEAISDYQLNPVCNSQTYQDDILEYQAYTNKIGVDFDIYNGQTLPDSSAVSGFDLQWDGTNVYFDMPTGYPALFGHYFYLYAEFDGGSYFQDGCFEPLTPVIAECQYPFTSDEPIYYFGVSNNSYNYPKAMSRLAVSADGMKVILLDLSQTDFNNYDSGTLYVNTVYAIGDAYGWVTKRNDTKRNIVVPFDFRGRKYRRYEVNLTPVNSLLGLGYWGQGDVYLSQTTTGNYIDVPSFSKDGNDAFNIEWNDMGGPDVYYYCGNNDNNVFLGQFKNNKLDAYVYDNTSGTNFYQNTIGNYFYKNTLGNSFVFNTIKDNFYQNKIANNFTLNKIGNYFFQNTIGSTFTLNKIENNFYLNTTGNNFKNNEINVDFTNKIINNNFNYNIFQNTVTGITFSSATHVYQTYNCTIFKASDNNTYLSYFDGTAMQYVSANS